jgi:hypothetical protein
MHRQPWWRDRVLQMLSGSPDLFASLLAVHLGEESLSHLAVTRSLQLGFRLLIPTGSTSASWRSTLADDCRDIA